MEILLKKGYLKKFIIIYFDELYSLGYTYVGAISFFKRNYKENQTNNLFDFIELAKQQKN